MFKHKVVHREKFVGSKVAVIDGPKCTNCGKCVPLCRFAAIKKIGSHNLRKVAVDEGCCEGCGLCFRICPSKAIRMVDRHVGEWFVSDTPFGKMVHALLEPGAENSGRLVAMVKQKARMVAKDQGADMILVDGPPGIGCSVISSLSGANVVVVVTEPTQSGLSDMKRVLELADGFRLRTALVTNKADINNEITDMIEAYAREAGVEVLGRIPYDEILAKTMAQGRTVDKSVASPAMLAMAMIHGSLTALLEQK